MSSGCSITTVSGFSEYSGGFTCYKNEMKKTISAIGQLALKEAVLLADSAPKETERKPHGDVCPLVKLAPVSLKSCVWSQPGKLHGNPPPPHACTFHFL